jgi:hypothetical protein
LISIIVPGALSYDAGSADQTFRDLTLFFGLYSMNTNFNDPRSGTLSDVVNRRGRGRPGGYCQRSGNYFPEERLRVDGDGRLVGDIFYTTGTPRQGDDSQWP